MTTDERRQFHRIPFDAVVTLTGTDQSWTSSLIDLSLKGALIQLPENWKPDTRGQFKMVIQLEGTEQNITMEVEIAHTEDDHIGCQCLHIDIDSISCLKRLLELNLGDEELFNRELSTLLNKPT